MFEYGFECEDCGELLDVDVEHDGWYWAAEAAQGLGWDVGQFGARCPDCAPSIPAHEQ